MGDYWNRSKKWRRRHDRLWRAGIRRMRERHFRKCLRMFGPTNPTGTERRHRLIRAEAPELLRKARHALREWIDRGAPREWTPESWNTCPACGESIDADEVFAGSEVHCGCCNRWFVVTEFVGLDGSSVWELRETDDADDNDEGEAA